MYPDFIGRFKQRKVMRNEMSVLKSKLRCGKIDQNLSAWRIQLSCLKGSTTRLFTKLTSEIENKSYKQNLGRCVPKLLVIFLGSKFSSTLSWSEKIQSLYRCFQMKSKCCLTLRVSWASLSRLTSNILRCSLSSTASCNPSFSILCQVGDFSVPGEWAV